MKLSDFSGGLNTRLSAHLIGANEATQFTNIDTETKSLIPIKQKKDIGISLLEHSFFFNAIAEWVTASVNRDYVEYRNTLYFTEDLTNPKKTTDNINFYTLGITKPIITPITVIGAVGVLTGTYTYVTTFYNSSDGAESGISPASVELVATTDQINLSNLEISTDPQVDKKRIYRLGGNLTVYTLVTTIDNADTTYIDNIADTNVEGTILESSTYDLAPSGLKFLTEQYGLFIGAIADRVYFTPIGKPNAWPPLNYIDFDGDVTGVGKIFNGIIVFTLYKAYVITGTNINSFVKTPLSLTQGCKEHKSIQYISRGELLWVSNDGICVTSGGAIKVLTRDKLGKQNYDVKNAVVHDEVYYLQLSSGLILAIDTNFGLKFKSYNPGTTRLVIANDILYGFVNNTLYEMFADVLDENYTWVSPDFIDGSYTKLKQYKKIYIRAEGDCTFVVLVDGGTVLTKSLTGVTTHELKVPQDKQDGYAISFKITGTAVVKEIEYTPLPRRSD